MSDPFEIFMVAPPGLEDALLSEARDNGFAAQGVPGGVTLMGDWPDVWRANLVMRGATRVLARIGSFMAFHLAQLDKRSRKFDFGKFFPPNSAIRVEVVSRKSKIYHAGAAQQRIEDALKHQGFTVASDAPVSLKVRIEDNRVTLSVDTSGESLHKRGHKEAVGKAPMRETLAALMLRACGSTGQEPVADLMCGSGTFVIEAAEMSLGLHPGRTRSFAFEHLAGFDADQWAEMKKSGATAGTQLVHTGSDRDAGAVRMATANAERAGVSDQTRFACLPFTDARPPDGAAGLVMLNPPYGARIGRKHMLHGLHARLGETLLTHWTGWRVGLVTSEPGLAQSTGLPFGPPSAPIPHGGLKVRLYQTATLR